MRNEGTKELSRKNFPAIPHCWTSQQWHPIAKSAGYILTSTSLIRRLTHADRRAELELVPTLPRITQ
jgi:hypothetical protein